MASSHGLVVNVVQALATREGWKVRFPPLEEESVGTNGVPAVEGSLESGDAYVEQVRKRLEIFTAAKDFLLAGHLAYTECRILDALIDAIESQTEGGATVDIKSLNSALSIAQNLRGSYIGNNKGDSALPTLLIEMDLTGTKQGLNRD